MSDCNIYFLLDIVYCMYVLTWHHRHHTVWWIRFPTLYHMAGEDSWGIFLYISVPTWQIDRRKQNTVYAGEQPTKLKAAKQLHSLLYASSTLCPCCCALHELYIHHKLCCKSSKEKVILSPPTRWTSRPDIRFISSVCQYLTYEHLFQYLVLSSFTFFLSRTQDINETCNRHSCEWQKKSWRSGEQ